MRLKLKSTLSYGSKNMSLDDSYNVKNFLSELGALNTGREENTPYADRELFDGIRHYQRGRGLKADGTMKPGGETERDMNRFKEIAKRSMQYKCKICGAFHGGVYSPDICHDCLS
ncbi:MAG: hypothetical protein ACTSXQ_02650 [Alphaproteobacteria bacterium]